MLKRLYEKNEIGFAIFWIVLYVVVMGDLRGRFGDGSLYTVFGVLVIALVLTILMLRNGLREKYGLIAVKNARALLYFLPLALLPTVNIWFGVSLPYSMPYQLYAFLTMGLIGYVEEILFRGLLFRGLERESTHRAIIISAVTFGLGHVVNLLTGQGRLEVVLQMAYAIAIGFAFVLVFYKSGSLLPCILAHSSMNILSTFSDESAPQYHELKWIMIQSIFLLVVAGGYAWYLYRYVEKQDG